MISVAVTGLGMVTHQGSSRETTFERVVKGPRSLDLIRLFQPKAARAFRVAEVTEGGFLPDALPKGHVEVSSPTGQQQAEVLPSRTERMARLAAKEALASAKISNCSDVHLICAGTTGGLYEIERIVFQGADQDQCARAFVQRPLWAVASYLDQSLGPFVGSHTLSAACAGGASAIALGARLIAAGKAATILAGGAEGLSELVLTGFASLGLLANGKPLPFQRLRDGLVLGEGAAFLVLESADSARRRGAEIMAWVEGASFASEGFHLTQPDPAGQAASKLFRSVLEGWAATQAGAYLSVQNNSAARSAIDCVSAHGTGTPANDHAEARALRLALGESLGGVTLMAAKQQVGHCLAAGGAIEAGLVVMSAATGSLPESLGLAEVDPELGLPPFKSSKAPLRSALTSSLGFGGAMASLLLRASEPDLPASPAPHVSVRAVVRTGATIGPLGVLGVSGNSAYLRPHELQSAAGSRPRSRGYENAVQWAEERLDSSRTRRFDALSMLITSAIDGVLSFVSPEQRADVGLVVGHAYGNTERTLAYLKRLSSRGIAGVSPAEFPHLVPSGPAANASVYHGLRGPVLTVLEGAASFQASLEVAVWLLETGLCSRVVAACGQHRDALLDRVPLERGFAPGGEGAAALLLEGVAIDADCGAAPFIMGHGRTRLDANAPRDVGAQRPSNPARARLILATPDRLFAVHGQPEEWMQRPILVLGDDYSAHEASAGLLTVAGIDCVARGEFDEFLLLTTEGPYQRFTRFSCGRSSAPGGRC